MRNVFRTRDADFAWHVIGDSHSRSFGDAATAGLLQRPCHVTSVAGATAVGLRNPNSQTDAISLFKGALLPVQPSTVPVFHLGEVDCGFVIWYRADKHGESIAAQTAQSIDAYFSFVDLLLRSGYRTAVITGATLPTIRDGQDWGEVANKRREVKATLVQRTQLTLRYNHALRTQAKRRGLPFIEITDAVLDPSTGTAREDWRHPDPTDHHLHPEKASALWSAKLNGVKV